MDNIAKQLIFASVLFMCTVTVICVHFFGQPVAVHYEDITLPEIMFFSVREAIPSQSTQDNLREPSFSPTRFSGALYCTANSMKLLTTVKIMLMLFAIGLFIRPERHEVEFILNSDGMK